MIIDFRNMNGGGGGGYVLPVATDTRLGGVKVGDFLSINSAGTLSVETTKRIGYVEYDGQVKVDDFITTMYSTFAFIKENDTNSDIELFTIVSYGNRTKAYLKSDNKYYVKQYDDTEIEITGNTPVNIYNATYTFDLSGNNLTVTADINGKDVVDLYSGTVSMFPIATTGSTGVVKIGSGITVDSAGAISVEAQGGGEATIVKSLEEAPTGLTEGDVFVMGDVHIYPRCQIEDNNMNTLSVGEHTIGNEENLYVWSEMADDKLVLQFGDYYNYKLFIYGGQDQHFRFETMFNNGVEVIEVDSGDIYQGETATTEFSNESVTFDLNFEGEGLQITISTPQGVPFTVFYNQEYKEMFLNDGTFMAKDSGERAKLEQWSDGKGFKTVFLYYGELPTNTILLKCTNTYEGITTYFSWDGEKLCSWNDEYMQSRGIYDFDFNAEKSYGYEMYRFYEGILSIISRGDINSSKWELVGNWYKYSSQTNEPSDWQSKCDNIRQFGYPLAACAFNDSEMFLGNNDIWINGVPSDGSAGQVLRRTSEGYGWESLVIPKTEIYQSLPYGGNEGDLALTNTEYYPYTAATFISMNSTSESDKNNFSNDNEIGWYDWGNNYIYFGNASAYTNTKDTFLYKIALRTNENGDWGTSNIAYINVLRKNDQYWIFMDNFSYYDTGGTPTPYTFTMYLSSTGTTSGNTPYLPLWKYWDGGYGYKFHFELDQDNNLKMWMRNSDADRDSQDPAYVEGQAYGGVGFKCMGHTEVFYDYINLDQDDTYISIYKGGVWYELGYLTRQGV